MSTFSKIFAFFALLVIASPVCAQQINVPAGSSWTATVTPTRTGNFQVIVNAGGNPMTYGTCEPMNKLISNQGNTVPLTGLSTITVKTGTGNCPITNWTVAQLQQPQSGNTYTFNGGANGDQIIVTIVDGSVGHGGGENVAPPPSH